MWYYDKYIKSNDLCTMLLSNYGENEYRITNNTLIGFIDKLPEVSATHTWKEAGSVVSKVFSATSKAFGEGYKMAEGAGNELVGMGHMMLDAENSQTSTTFYNSKQSNAASLMKEYDGTEVDITIPTFKKFYIADTDEADIRTQISIDIADTKLFGEMNIQSVDMSALPPNDFRYKVDYRDEVNVAGSFCMANAKFILRNLLPTNVNLEFSDLLIADTGNPAYAILTIQFTYGRKPVVTSIYDYIKNYSLTGEKYEKLKVMSDSYKNAFSSENSLGNK